MFDKFGEFDSYKEINTLADNLFNEGDLESIKVMARENGIMEEDVQAYLDGATPVLCDPLMAAIGKLEIECADLKPKGIMGDWVEYIKSQCLENDLMAIQVRRKGKTLKSCIADLLKWSFANQQSIDKEIVKQAGVGAGRVTLGIPGMGKAKSIIREYYMEARNG